MTEDCPHTFLAWCTFKPKKVLIIDASNISNGGFLCRKITWLQFMLTMYIFVNYGFKALKKVVIRKSSMNETEDGYLEP